MKIKVLYEDKDILAIDKPSGFMVHPDGKTREKTITDWIIKNYPKLKGVGEPVTFNEQEIDRPGIVHRLDKETSGVLIVVKTKEAFAYFKKQFMDREIKKTYIAIVSGWLKNDTGTINKSIGRSPSDFRRRLAGRGARGEMREAITEYKVLKRFKVPCAQNFFSCALPRVRGGTLGDKNFVHTAPFTYLEIKPKTGRTHQIRVHMKFLNHPIVCDSLYNPKGLCPKTLNRLALHAKSIEFKNLKGKIIKVESPVPEEFEKLQK
ncbi:RluA family pseudouridine synthase [Patescibacteria group bacterium]|nr:RluA family pseudouridine synthase [Patescibacteria group bacterium]MBU1728130.1 RluA family pseudouridine synthase [Patescibacteria group bacterium]